MSIRGKFSKVVETSNSIVIGTIGDLIETTYDEVVEIAKFYNKVSILTPEDVLYNDFVTLSAFKAWVVNIPELKEKKQKGEEVFLQVYSLGNKSKFVPARAGNFNTSVRLVCTSLEFFNAALKTHKKLSPVFYFVLY